MLATPMKSSTKRITSLFSLGSNKDGERKPSSPVISHQASPSSSSRSSPLEQQSFSPAIRNFSSPQTNQPYPSSTVSNQRIVSAPAPRKPLHGNDQLLPPPALHTVNPDLIDSSGDSGKKRQSWSGAIPKLSAALNLPSTRSGSTGPETRGKAHGWSTTKPKMSSTDASVSPMHNAWISGTEHDIPYDVGPLIQGHQVSELWDDRGDTYVYLFPKNTGRPPSFKVDSSIFAASQHLTAVARGPEQLAPQRPAYELPEIPASSRGSPSLSARAGSPYDEGSVGSTQSRDEFPDEECQELHLYLPVPLNSDLSNAQLIQSDDDIDMLVLFRNFFAFLIGQALVATPRCSSLFSIFTEIAALLDRFAFSNLDNSTYGEVATSSFGCYCEELDMIEVPNSPDKILDAIILGERMRYLPLYNEGFIHAVGALDDIKQISGKFAVVSHATQQRLERGHIDLENRLKTFCARLEDFDFPSLFSGIANSSVANEAKVIKFKNWKAGFLAFRKNMISYLRSRYGSWPPKANSKKNNSSKAGLNRLVLKELYENMTDLYDMLVDRSSLTTRSIDMTTGVIDADDDLLSSVRKALRQVMSEYDRSTPPPQPPIPFDTPLLPSVHSIRRNLTPEHETKERAKRLSSGEVNEILVGSYNHSSMKPTPFLENFMNFERRIGHGKSADELADMRCGQWLFMYAVIQSLPMVVIDAPDVRSSEGIEYFLCIPPRGGAPWCQNDQKTGRSWFGVAGGSGVVNLPSDVVANGIDAIYRRSHCWNVALKWADEQQMLSSVMLEPEEPKEHRVHQPQQQYPPRTSSSPALPAAYTPYTPYNPYTPNNPSSTYSTQPYQPYQQQSYQPPHQSYQPYQAYPPNQPNHLNFPPPPLSSNGSSSDRLPTPLLTPGDTTPPMVSLQPPNPGFLRAGNRSSIHMGLEALPLPAGIISADPSSRAINHNPNLSFDHILSQVPQKGKN
ncbi:hypothetical protein FQN57_001784 [Myotisia sp. PD_48]|nr:hypothetical protein FQN57_001784 [Myotisia sp. PD_48]